MDNTHPTHPLLVPRYRVNIKYPYAALEVGQIITFDEEYRSIPVIMVPHRDEFGLDGHIEFRWPEKQFKEHAELFESLPWYAERSESEMPQYVKHAADGEVREVDHFDVETTSAWFMYLKGEIHPFCPGGSALEGTHWLPATEADYHTYLQSQSNKQ